MMKPVNRNIVAIDGPSGVGKGTLAKNLCEKYAFACLDTGSLYRAATLNLLRENFGFDDLDEAAATRATRIISDNHKILELAKDPEIRLGPTTRLVARVSSIQPLRQVVRQYQVDFGHYPPNNAKGAVVEGRDIGTVIFPDAPVKIFLTASIEVKAQRRLKQYKDDGIEADYDELL
ncbi:MAG: (d)CMP kinase, partial [Rickettsiales bacterium]|nr:(d)CMP kinase [Rickettsiales bacterium]